MSFFTAWARRSRFGSRAIGCFVQDHELLEGTQVKVMDESVLRRRKEEREGKAADNQPADVITSEVTMERLEYEQGGGSRASQSFGPQPSQSLGSPASRSQMPEASNGSKGDKELLMEVVASLARRMDDVMARVNGLSSSVEGLKRGKSGLVTSPTVSQEADIQQVAREEVKPPAELGPAELKPDMIQPPAELKPLMAPPWPAVIKPSAEEVKPITEVIKTPSDVKPTLETKEVSPFGLKKERTSRTLPPMKPVSQLKAPAEIEGMKSPQEPPSLAPMNEVLDNTSKLPLLPQDKPRMSENENAANISTGT